MKPTCPDCGREAHTGWASPYCTSCKQRRNLSQRRSEVRK